MLIFKRKKETRSIFGILNLSTETGNFSNFRQHPKMENPSTISFKIPRNKKCFKICEIKTKCLKCYFPHECQLDREVGEYKYFLSLSVTLRSKLF